MTNHTEAKDTQQNLKEVLDSLVERKYQLRLEHNHSDMKWYAYYAGKAGRKLFDDDADWQTGSDNPLDAALKLQALQELKGEV